MRDFQNSLVNQLISEKAITFWLIDFMINDIDHERYCTLDIDIHHDGNMYRSEEFDIQPINHSLGMAVDKLALTFSNSNLSMSGILLNNNLAYKKMTVSIGALDGYTPVVEDIFVGFISEWELAKEVEIIISNEFIYWNKSTLRLPGDKCTWTFKKDECPYSGVESVCNRTYDRCADLGMTDSFGGFRFLPSIEEKRIQWGKQSI